MTMYTFQAGKGINANKINSNFTEVKDQANANESNINTIINTSLKKDGSNITDSIVNEFQKEIVYTMSGKDSIHLFQQALNSTTFLQLTGNGKIYLSIAPDQTHSNTVRLIVQGSPYSLDIQSATGNRHLYNNLTIDTTKTYCVLFLFNKLDSCWYYSLTQ